MEEARTRHQTSSFVGQMSYKKFLWEQFPSFIHCSLSDLPQQHLFQLGILVITNRSSRSDAFPTQ